MNLAVPLGLSSAALYGAADFVSHFANKRSGVLRTMLHGQILLAILVTAAILATGGLPAVSPRAWTILFASDVAILAGTVCLYRALATGDLAVVPPVTACYGAVAAALSIASGERVAPLALAGVALAVGGGAVTSIPARGASGGVARKPSGAWLAAGAALLYGVGFWAQGRYAVPVVGGLAAVWSYYTLGAAILVVVAVATRTPLRPPPLAQSPAIFATALLALGGYLAVAFGQATGRVAVVTALSSVASAVTVILACVFLKQPVAWRGWAGLAAVIAGLIALRLA